MAQGQRTLAFNLQPSAFPLAAGRQGVDAVVTGVAGDGADEEVGVFRRIPEAELGEVLKWRAGDTLELHVPEEQRVTVTCGKIPLFSARLGQMNGHKAIKVEADLGGKEDMVDALVSR